MKVSALKIYDDLFNANPDLEVCRNDISKAFEILCECYKSEKMVLICGNGGRAADSEHIVGELMKGFRLKRIIVSEDAGRIQDKYISKNLQGALPAVSLVSQTALSTAFSNDVAADMVFAQQVYGYRKLAGALIGISTSGNATNVGNAAAVAKAFGIPSIGLTGKSGGRLDSICDVTIKVPSTEVYRVQEYHLPVYHALCAMLEAEFFE